MNIAGAQSVSYYFIEPTNRHEGSEQPSGDIHRQVPGEEDVERSSGFTSWITLEEIQHVYPMLANPRTVYDIKICAGDFPSIDNNGGACGIWIEERAG